MNNSIKRLFYRMLMMAGAIALKIIVIQDIFIVITRAIMDGENNASSLSAIILSSIVSGLIVGEMMFCRMRDNVNEKKETIEYFETREFNMKSCMKYILNVRGELMDYIIYAVILLVLLLAIYTIRMITTSWMFIFEALFVYVFMLITSVICELIEKYRLCDAWVNPDEYDC